MHPVLHGLVSESGSRLRYLALVVREHEIQSAAVNVECLAKVFCPHGRALEVPSWESVAPRRRPAHDVLRLRFLPQGEVVSVVLFGLTVQLACSLEKLLDIASGQLAVVEFLVVFLHVEVYRAVALVSVAVLEYLLDVFNLLYDVARSVRFDAWRQHVQQLHVVVVAV